MPDAFADLAPRMDFRLPLLLAMLLLVAYPAYTDYHARGKTSEVLAALMPARAALVRQIGSLPADIRPSLGLRPVESQPCCLPPKLIVPQKNPADFRERLGPLPATRISSRASSRCRRPARTETD